nr:hypothetical protein [Caulobacter sp. B11]
MCGRFRGWTSGCSTPGVRGGLAVGDAVLAGGEAAAMVVIEACVRLAPGVLGNIESTREESFEDGLLEHPQYTRPRTFEGLGHPRGAAVGRPQRRWPQWRNSMREDTTRERRPDLWEVHLANQQAKGGPTKGKPERN